VRNIKEGNTRKVEALQEVCTGLRRPDETWLKCDPENVDAQEAALNIATNPV